MYYVFGCLQRRDCYERLSEHNQMFLIHKALKYEVHFFAIYIAMMHHNCRYVASFVDLSIPSGQDSLSLMLSSWYMVNI